MAATRSTRAKPAGPRRSARLQGTAPPADPLNQPHAHNNRVNKPKPTPKPKPKRYDCTTCDRNLATSLFPKYLPTDNCSHLINTCKACLKEWIAAQLEGTTYDKISCPQCSEIMQNADVELNAFKKSYAKFNELERRGIAEKIPGWRWCLKCRSGQVHQPLLEISPNTASTRKRSKKSKKDTTGQDIFVCNDCGAEACVPCDRPYHTGETCAEYQKRIEKYDEEEKATLKTIEQECKKCPHCKTNIQREYGCDHMICTECRTAFCWLCSVTYVVINKEGHAKDCIYSQPGRIDPHAMHLANAAPANNIAVNNVEGPRHFPVPMAWGAVNNDVHNGPPPPWAGARAFVGNIFGNQR